MAPRSTVTVARRRISPQTSSRRCRTCSTRGKTSRWSSRAQSRTLGGPSERTSTVLTAPTLSLGGSRCTAPRSVRQTTRRTTTPASDWLQRAAFLFPCFFLPRARAHGPWVTGALGPWGPLVARKPSWGEFFFCEGNRHSRGKSRHALLAIKQRSPRSTHEVPTPKHQTNKKKGKETNLP